MFMMKAEIVHVFNLITSYAADQDTYFLSSGLFTKSGFLQNYASYACDILVVSSFSPMNLYILLTWKIKLSKNFSM